MAPRDVDIALARALGWEIVEYPDHDRRFPDHTLRTLHDPDDHAECDWTDAPEQEVWQEYVPHFSRDWTGLGLLVEAMRQRGWTWHVNAYPPVPNLGLPVAVSWGHSTHLSAQATGHDIPHESALAAARALGLTVEE